MLDTYQLLAHPGEEGAEVRILKRGAAADKGETLERGERALHVLGKVFAQHGVIGTDPEDDGARMVPMAV